MQAFALRPFDTMTKEALASVATERVGDEAITELAYRRRGLIIATAVILGFLVTLGWKIRDLSRRPGRS